MKKKPRPKPVVVQGCTFADVMADMQKKADEAYAYVQQTGKCCACKENPVQLPALRCEACVKKEQELVRKCMGPGFMGIGFYPRRGI